MKAVNFLVEKEAASVDNSNPRAKMLMRFRKKAELVQLARDFKVSKEGTKQELAARVAEAQEEERVRIWNAIVGGK